MDITQQMFSPLSVKSTKRMDLLIDTVLKNLIKNKFELKAENDCFCENHHTERIVSALINCFLRIRTDLQGLLITASTGIKR